MGQVASGDAAPMQRWPHKQCATSNFSNLRKRKAKQRGEASEECSWNAACGGGKQAKGMREVQVEK